MFTQDSPTQPTASLTVSAPSEDAAISSGVWNSVECPDAFATDFYEVLVLVGRALSANELSRLSGCVGYGLRAALCGEELSAPHDVTYWQDEEGRITTIAQYAYDSTKSIRTEPDFAAAFALARQYVAEGTPVRRTDRAGRGTRGTRLVEGIGDCPVAFYVR